MSPRLRKVFIVLSCIVLCLVLVSISVEPFLSKQVNKTALSRRAIQCGESVESKVLAGIVNGSLPTNLAVAFGIEATRLHPFGEGAIKTTQGNQPTLLDGWKMPLHVMSRSNLLILPGVSPLLLAKTNEVIIWSSGINGINEFGNGDDIFLR